MCSFISRSTRTKLDWFVNGQLKQTFDSYTHAAEVLKKELNNEFINESLIRNLIIGRISIFFRKILVLKKNVLINTFKNNIEFMNFYNIPSKAKACNVINRKVKTKELKDCEIKIIINIPDIRLHIYEEIDKYYMCSCCEDIKQLTEQNFSYKNKKEGVFNNKCKECFFKKIRTDTEYINKFTDNLDDTWKHHPEFINFYFERNTTKIFNKLTGKYITCNPVINNKEMVTRNLKWEAFYGKIPENKIVKYKSAKPLNDNDDTELDNLECVYIYCDNCEKMIENPTISNVYCSKKCQTIKSMENKKIKNNTNLELYIRQKWSNQKYINKKYKTVINYNTDYLLLLGMNCFYCNIECKFGYEKDSNHPDTISYDKKNPDIGYTKENIVVCCWFCNRMKNQTSYEDWNQFIDFIKNPENLELDLSTKQFAKKSNEIKLSNIYFHIKQKSPNYYPDLKITRQIFINQCQIQNYLDPFFNFFPIIYLETNCLFNASIDAIDANLPEEEKHRPNNLQIIPKCFNYGKVILSNKQFLEEWIKRGFKTNFTNCNVKLPEKYYLESYFDFILS